MIGNFPKMVQCLLLVVGLAAFPSWSEPLEGLSAEREAALVQKVRERWQAKIEKDFERVWEYSTPTFRGIFPKSLYVYNFSYAVGWELTSIEVVNYDAVAAVASVSVGVMSLSNKHASSASRALGPVPSTLREKWIFTAGEWWHSTNE